MNQLLTVTKIIQMMLPFVDSYEDNSNEVANIAANSLSPTPTELECVIIDNSTNHSSLKCTGLLYEVDVFKNFPFAVLASQEFVIENQNFHHQMCMENNYTIYEVSQDDKNLNKCCYDITFSTKYKKFLANSQNSEIYKTHAKNELLSFNQMAQRINNYRSQLQKQLQITMNKSKQLLRLNKTLSLHQHFLFLLKENKIH